jgi:hypothetical protein
VDVVPAQVQAVGIPTCRDGGAAGCQPVAVVSASVIERLQAAGRKIEYAALQHVHPIGCPGAVAGVEIVAEPQSVVQDGKQVRDGRVRPCSLAQAPRDQPHAPPVRHAVHAGWVQFEALQDLTRQHSIEGIGGLGHETKEVFPFRKKETKNFCLFPAAAGLSR